MNNLLQSILGKVDWFELLLPIVIFAGYIISAIVKKSKVDQQQKDKPKQVTRARRRPSPEYRRTPATPRPAPQKPTPVAQQRAPRLTKPAPAKPQPRAPRYTPHPEPAVRTPRTKQPDRTSRAYKQPRSVKEKIKAPPKPVQKGKTQKVKVAEKKPVKAGSPVHPVLSLENIAENKNLRNAIVLSEILGKPLALRDMP